jgi:exopolysaccharide production protein ExoZ
MLFYLVFASALFLRVAPLRVVGPIMAVLALLSVFRTENSPAITTLASPIVLEFVFGVLVGRAVLSGMLQRFSSPWTVVVSAVGLSCLVFVPIGDAWSRAAIWGLAASATLAGCVLAERWLDRFLPRLLVKIGEASYSLYLTHGFVLPVVGLALAKSGLTGGALGGALIASCVIASTVVALVSYRFVEAPITSRLRLLVGDGRRVSLAAPQSAI